MIMKKLNQITVVGTGLLGGSLSRAILRCLPKTKVVGYSHRPSTRQKARQLSIASEIADDLGSSVTEANMVILATPIFTFQDIFRQIASQLPADCIVTDVGSTKVLPHRWAAKQLPRSVDYVGSHPIAGSEQRGVEFARDDLFDNTNCILTSTKTTNADAKQTVKNFWIKLGCKVVDMSPAQHDRIFAMVSHLPHVAAAAMVNANSQKDLEFAGSGFIDSTRIAAGSANIWTDVLLCNKVNTCDAIDKLIAELKKLKTAIGDADKNKIEKLLIKANQKRAALINHKMQRKELIS